MRKTTLEREAQYRDLSALSRSFPGGLPVRAVGYLPAKSNKATRTFDRLSFMFLLRGAGFYQCNGEKFEVRSPCVLTGFPGDQVDYAPYTTWEMCYVNYEAKTVSAFKAKGFTPRTSPVWSVYDEAALQQGVMRLLQATKRVGPGVVDLIDRLCETLILECLINASLPPPSADACAINKVRAYLERHFNTQLDMSAVAEAHGFSASSFRRKWAIHMGMPPNEYICRLRIQEAARLLVSSARSIKSISTSVGFVDPRYFARCFRQITGEAASEYRHGHSLE